MKQFSIITIILSALLAGCGGGSSTASSTTTSAPVASSLTFPFGMKSLIAAGYTKNFTVTGACSGSGSTTVAKGIAATFESVSSALSSANTNTMTLSSCTGATVSGATISNTTVTNTPTEYFDSNYLPLGFNTGATTQAANYGVFQLSAVLPASVKVGDTGTIGTQNLYTDSTKATLFGTAIKTYVIESDTATTAIVNLVSKTYNTSNPSTLLRTTQTRYRMASDGTLTPLSVDIQYPNGAHLLATYN